jgi:transcriptional regulator with GAF, ATPase, and Fis domain
MPQFRSSESAHDAMRGRAAHAGRVLTANGGNTSGHPRPAPTSDGGDGQARTEGDRIPGIVGASERMLDVYKVVAQIAPTRSTVLIQGETGTGKELIARAIHSASRRSHRQFVTVDCSALAESLLESELFGHIKGAFTGALTDKRGFFETADGGTCFLDEVGELSPCMQARLLRVLQEHEVRRVGGTDSFKVDVRVIAATPKKLLTTLSEERSARGSPRWRD